MNKTYYFEFCNNKPTGGNFHLLGEGVSRNRVLTSKTDELLDSAFPLGNDLHYKKVVLPNFDDFTIMRDLKENDTMYDIRFYQVEYIDFLKIRDTVTKILESSMSKDKITSALRKELPVGKVMNKNDILNMYTIPYGFRSVASKDSHLSTLTNTGITDLVGKAILPGTTADIGDGAVGATCLFNIVSGADRLLSNGFTFYDYDDGVPYKNKYTVEK